MQSPSETGWDRLGFQNVCGIDRGRTPAQEVLDAMEAYDIGIYGIAEPNAVMTGHLKNAINVQIKKRFGYGFIAASSGPGRKLGYNPGVYYKLYGASRQADTARVALLNGGAFHG